MWKLGFQLRYGGLGKARGMKIMRRLLLGMVVALGLLSLFPQVVTRAPYDRQFREAAPAAPSKTFLLGTDEMGRDRMARLLYGTRISLLLAPVAALLAIILALVTGATAGFLGGWYDRVITPAIDLTLSLPWLFVLITVRALMPLNVSPLLSVTITFGMLALVGWAQPARVVRAAVRSLRESDVILQAKATGCRRRRLLVVHLLPLLRPIVLAQFCTAVPIFILSEANLSLLGVGVGESLPSWGNLLRELESQPALSLGLLAPLLLLILVVGCFQASFSIEDLPS